jgi:dolichol-phosphate mannosyltransferase
MEISVIVPAFNEGETISSLLKKIRKVLDSSGRRYEIIVADGGSLDGTRELAKAAGADRIFIQKSPGYGGALKEAFALARGDYFLTLDCDFSHDPYYLLTMLEKTASSSVVIASRYVRGGVAQMPLSRLLLSLVLNRVFTFVLALPFKDISSGFRLYDRKVIEKMEITSRDFDVLEEIVIKAYNSGWKITEIPFVYTPRRGGKSHAKLLQFGISFARTLLAMRRLRRSPDTADHADRAFRSWNPLLRYRQRKRFFAILDLIQKEARILYDACGSSTLIQALPQAIGVDRRTEKLRYLRQTHTLLVQSDLEKLPFVPGCFDCVILSEVSENAAHLEELLTEARRVLQDRGTVIVAAPRVTSGELKKKTASLGFGLVQEEIVCGAEIILKAEKNA